VREDALQYHKRIVDEFTYALINKADARDEAVNVLLSANNLENQGYTQPLFKKNAKAYIDELQPELQVRNPSDRGMERIFSGGSTIHEPAPSRHHKARPLFHSDDWAKAMMTGDEKSIDAMVRMAIGRRFDDTIPNIAERGDDIVGKHSMFKTLNLHPSRKDEVAYGEKPLWQQLNRYLYGNKGKNAERLNEAMIKTADGLHPVLKQQHMFGKWRGNNVTLKSIYKTGKDEFIKAFGERYGKGHDLLAHPMLDEHFMRVKNWENEGVPREEIFDLLFDDDGNTIRDGDGKQSPIQQLRELADGYNDTRRKPVKDQRNFGRIGDDIHRLGISMLPYDDIYKIKRWMLETSGGVQEDGSIDDSFINKILGPGARGYMANHAYLMDNMLNTLYAGGSNRNGMNHVLPNRFTERAAREAKKDIDEKHQDIREKLEDNKWGRIEDDTLQNALQDVDFNQMVGRYKEKHADSEVIEDDDNPQYPHINESEYGTFIYMTSELPDMKDLVNHGLFEDDELKSIIEQSLISYGSKEYADIMRQTLQGYTHTHKTNEEFDMTKEPLISKSPLGILMEGVGHRRGNADGESADFGVHYQESMPNMLYSPLPERRFMLPSRGEKEGGGSRKSVEQINEFDPAKADDEGQMRVDLERTLRKYNIQNYEEQLAQFDNGEVVRLEVPRKETTSQDVAEGIINPFAAEENPEDLLRPQEQLEEYTEGMPSPMTPATRGLNSWMMAHGNYLGVNMKDHVGFTALDGLPVQSTEASLHTPMLTTRKSRINAQSNGKRRMFDRREIEGGKGNFGITKNNHSQEDKMMIDAGLLGLHNPLTQHDDAALEFFNKLMNGEIENPLQAIKDGSHHKDIIGYGGRTGRDMMREISEGVEEPTQFAIYHKEDLDNYNMLNFNDTYELPDAQVQNIRSRGRLLQELKGLDQEYIQAKQAGDDTAMGNRHEELEKMLKNYKDDKGKVVAYRQHGDEENPALSALVIAPTPSYLASQHQTMLGSALQIARKNNDEDSQEMIEKRMMEIRRAAPPLDGGEVKLNHSNQRISNHLDTLRGVEKIYKALQPAIEKIYPDVYTKENNEAHAATAYTLKLAEQILHMEPDEKRKLFSGENNIKLGGKSASFDLSTDEVEALANIKVKRDTHQDSSYQASEMKDGIFGGVQPSGYKVMSHLAKDSNEIDEEEIRMFDTIISSVKKAAAQQQISFDEAFKARYHPVSKDGRAIRGEEKSEVYDIINIPKRSGNNFVFNDGGLFHGQDMTRSGGESILDKKGNPINMNKERELIVKLLHNTVKQTREGSDVGLDTKKLQSFKGYLPSKARKLMDFNKPSSLQKIASLLNDSTSTQIFDKSSSTEESTVIGGSNFNNAPVVPIHTSADKKFNSGFGTTTPFIARPGAMADGNLYLEDNDNHVYNPPSPQQMVFPRDMMRRVNPALKPLDPSTATTHMVGYQHSDNEPNPNTRVGQAINQTMAMQSDMPLTPGAMQSTDPSLFAHSSHLLDVALDDTLIIKDDGKPQPVKFMHRIFDLEDLKQLRGFVGDWVISLYPQGEHIIATKKGKKMTAYGADGDIKLDKIFNEEVTKVYEKDFVVHAILHDGIMTVIDLLKTADEETHNMPTKDRIRHLRAQYESSEHIKMPEPINTKRSDDEGLSVAVESLQNENNMDILLRDANATYMKGEPRHPKWVLLSKEKMVDVIILSRAGKNYTIGVGPLMNPEHYGKRAQQVGKEHYMNVGSAKGPRGFNVGDFATVRCTGVSASKSEHPVYRIRSAKLTDAEPLAANSVETLAILAGDHHIPQQVNMKKGKITIMFPAFDDEVICKTHKEDGFWYVEPQSSIWGNEYLVKLANDQEAYWEAKAIWLLKREESDEPEYDEVNPEPPAGHSKKPKKILEEEEEVIKRGLELMERGLEHLSKEKITSTGVQGLGIGYASLDHSPRGPTENIRDDTMPDFDPQARRDDELQPATEKKTKTLRTSEGETARLKNNGVVEVDDSSFDIA
tara:strand:- start:8922 stop:14888 length:5967 start_codon:yes stop_codon:yes gene_type:complete